MHFGILGPLAVRSDDVPIDVGGAKARALLVVLLLRREPVSVERLALALFGEGASESSIKAVRVYVSRLRKALGDPEALTTTPAGYLLRGELDAERFHALVAEGRAALAAGAPQLGADRLREALALWRGPPLADVDLALAAEEARRLEESRLAALELRIEADLALGAHAELVGELATLVRAHPLRERLHELLMLALYRGSRQAEALDVYQQARATLVSELGLEPGPRLRELQQAILRQDPRLDPAPAQDAPALAFVGREGELRALTAALDAAIAGAGSLALLCGEPGIGKSRLIEELAHRSRARGVEVLVGRCWEAGGAPPYWPWVQSLRAHLASVGDAALARALGGRGALTQLAPELRKRVPDLPETPRADSQSARFELFDALAAFLHAAATARPIMLVIDDLHAADAPSMLLLRYLTRTLPGARMLVVCAYRDVDPIPESMLVETLAEVSREPGTRRFDLVRLTEPEVAAYISATAPGLASVCAALHAETDGNPLFMTETVRLLAAEGTSQVMVPPTVRDVVQRRVGALSPACGALLTEASVLGREFDVDTLVRLGGENALDLLDEALATRVVTDLPGAPGRLRFAHVVIRDTLYEGLTSIRRVQLHRRALAALPEDAPLSERAHHALAGQDYLQAVDLARRAGDRARSLHAYEEAVRLYRLALDALGGDRTERCELLLALGEAAIRAGDLPAGKRAFLDAAAIARELGLPRHFGRAAYGYGGRNVWARAGTDHEIIALLEEGLELLGDADPELRILMLSRLAGALRDEHSRARRDRVSAEAVELARRAGSDAALAYALTARTAATIGPDTLAECIARGREMEEIALRCGDLEQLAAAYTHQCTSTVCLGDTARVEQLNASAIRIAEQIRQPARIWLAYAQRDGLRLLKGDLDGLEQTLDETHAIGRVATPEMAVPGYVLQRFTLATLRGTPADLESELAQLLTDFPWRAKYRCMLSTVHAATGRTAEAQDALRALAHDDCAALPFDMEWLCALSFLAETCARVGDRETAPALYRLLLPYAHLNASDFQECIRGPVAHYLGLIAPTDEAAEGHFRAAEAMSERMGARPWLELTRAELRSLAARPQPQRHV